MVEQNINLLYNYAKERQLYLKLVEEKKST